MATYLPGVTPYIPQIQPYQEDLNFYANVLGTKQQQYDSNYKQLNQVYGQYFYADLTREGNIEKKEELLKNINFNLQRVSGLDLSLEQNVNQAVQVFKPFYEDKFLMKDMAWTKNYKREKGYAEGLRKASDPERATQFWDTGIKALDYKRLEFAESSDEESLNFGAVRYTPYVNVTKEAMAIAKEANLSIESVDFSPDGKWIIKQKNGQALTEPLSKLFEATLANDPRIQEIYQTQAYVNRKDYAYNNAAQFNGDVKAAEMKYLQDGFTMFKQQNQIQKRQLEQTSTVYDNKIKDIEAQIANGTADPQAKLFLEQLKSNKEINDSSLARVRELDDRYQEVSSTLSTSTGFQDAFGDIESLRNKVDAGMAASLLQKDLGEAAQIFAYRNSSVDIDANPYAINEQKHMFSMQEIAARNSGLERVARLKASLDRKNLLDTEKLKTGDYHMIETDIYDDAGNVIGTETQVVPNENLDELFPAKTGESATGEINAYRLGEARGKEVLNENLIPLFQETYNIFSQLKEKDLITDKEIRQILKGRSLEQFKKNYEKYPNHFARNVLGEKGLTELMASIDNFMIDEQNLNLSQVKGNRDAYLRARLKADTYTKYLAADTDWRKKTTKIVEDELYNQKFKYAKYLFDDNGRMRSEEEFYLKVSETEDLRNLIDPKKLLNYVSEKGVLAAVTGRNPQAVLQSKQLVEWLYPEEIEKIKKSKGARSLYKEELDYDTMKKAAGKIYSDSNRIEMPLSISTGGKLGTGLGTEMQGVTVSPKSPWFKGTAHWNSFVKDFRRMDLGSDNVRMSVSGFGTSKPSTEMAGLGMEESTLNSLLGDMVNQLSKDVSNTKSGLGNFDIYYSDIAEGKADRSAIKITPDSKWVNDYLNSKKAAIGEDDHAALLKAITTDGISVIADRNQFNNSLKRAATMKPVEAVVEYNNEYSYTDPVSKSTFYVKKDPSGLNKYSYNLSYGIWDPERQDFISHSGESLNYNIGAQTLPDVVLSDFMDYLPMLHEFNRQQGK